MGKSYSRVLTFLSRIRSRWYREQNGQMARIKGMDEDRGLRLYLVAGQLNLLMQADAYVPRL